MDFIKVFCFALVLTASKSYQSYLLNEFEMLLKFVDSTSSCLESLVRINFDSLSEKKLLTVLTQTRSFGLYELQDMFLKQLHANWSLEITNGSQTVFYSYRKCISCTPGKKIYKNYFQVPIKSDLYLIIVDHLELFTNITDFMVTMKSFNSRARFIVFVNQIMNNATVETAKAILENYWKLQIYKSLVVLRLNVSYMEVYKFDIYRNMDICGGNPYLLLVNKCVNGKIDKQSYLFTRLRFNTLQNCVLNVTSMKYPPFVLNNYSGIEIELINLLANKLNFTLDIQVGEQSTDWGKRLPNKTWSGKVLEILNTGVIGIGNIQAAPEMYEDFDLTTEYLVETIYWVVPKSEIVSYWVSIYRTFSLETWLINLSIIVGASILYYSFFNLVSNKKISHIDSILVVVQIFLSNALANKPKRRLPRMIFLSLALYAIILDAIYQSYLVNILTNSQYEHQISTEEEMLESPLSIGGISAYKDIFDVPSDERSAKIYARYKTVVDEYDTFDYWLRSVSQYRNTCSIMGGYYIRYLMASRDPLMMTYYGQPKVYVIRKRLLQYRLRIIMSKGHFLLRPFNKYINQFRYYGLVKKWKSQYMKAIASFSQEDNWSNVDIRLTLEHLKGVFALLVVGQLCGLLLLIFEIIWHKYQRYIKFRTLLCFMFDTNMQSYITQTFRRVYRRN